MKHSLPAIAPPLRPESRFKRGLPAAAAVQWLAAGWRDFSNVVQEGGWTEENVADELGNVARWESEVNSPAPGRSSQTQALPTWHAISTLHRCLLLTGNMRTGLQLPPERLRPRLHSASGPGRPAWAA